MYLWDFFVALLIAALLTAIFGGLLGGHRTAGALIFFFVVLLFGTWAGGLWLTPMGPIWSGGSWISFIFVGLFFALILAAAIPPRRNRSAADDVSDEAETASLVAFGIFFWILIGGLIVAIISRYLTV